MNEIIIKKFEAPDKNRIFERGKFELIKLKDMIISNPCFTKLRVLRTYIMDAKTRLILYIL